MKKIFTLMLIVIVGFAMMIGCSNSDNNIVDEQMNDNVVDEQSNDSGVAQQAEDNSSGGNNISASSNKWPNVKNIPEFTYGDIKRVEEISDTFEGLEYLGYNIFLENIEEGAGERYAKDLVNAGFRESQPPNNYSDTLTGTAVTEYGHDIFVFETEERICNTQVDHWVDDNNKGAVYITIPINAENGGGQTNNGDVQDNEEVVTADNENNDNGGSEFNWDTLSEKEVPDGYPHNKVPLFEGNGVKLLGADYQDAGGVDVYIVILGCDKSISEVSDIVNSTLKKTGGLENVLNGQMFMGSVDGWDFTVAIGDGSGDGFVSTIDYTVMSHK
ncbi:MAG: hypothetical protein ACOWWH_11745 [Eubacteriaceae bacterium]